MLSTWVIELIRTDKYRFLGCHYYHVKANERAAELRKAYRLTPGYVGIRVRFVTKEEKP
jgi:hypothetical protein